jgi:hypothetical protein
VNDELDRANVRMEILKILWDEPGFTANQETLKTKLMRKAGLNVSSSKVRVELAWLDRAAAIVNRSSGGVMIATLSDVGQEHLESRAPIPDIRPPRAGEIMVTG